MVVVVVVEVVVVVVAVVVALVLGHVLRKIPVGRSLFYNSPRPQKSNFLGWAEQDEAA